MERTEEKRVYDRAYYLKHREAKLLRTREHMREVKREILSYYSNSKQPKCLWCGEDRIACLSIDHIDGDGASERRRLGYKSVSYLYWWLRKQGYPEGYQTLCMNCQFVKRDANKEYRRR